MSLTEAASVFASIQEGDLAVDCLDSRSLRASDCYGQRFMKVGLYPYNVLPAQAHGVTDRRPFAIRVVQRTAAVRMTPHRIEVSSDGRRFRVDRDEVVVEAGDLVLWHCADEEAPPYTVRGDREFFSSHRLVNESGYGHVFGSAGEYHWGDAHGSGAAGVVRVKHRGCADDARLEKGALVTIDDGAVEPREIEVLTGQAVFFAVVKGPGISITDRRVLAREEERRAAAPTRRRRKAARSSQS